MRHFKSQNPNAAKVRGIDRDVIDNYVKSRNRNPHNIPTAFRKLKSIENLRAATFSPKMPGVRLARWHSAMDCKFRSYTFITMGIVAEFKQYNKDLAANLAVADDDDIVVFYTISNADAKNFDQLAGRGRTK